MKSFFFNVGGSLKDSCVVSLPFGYFFWSSHSCLSSFYIVFCFLGHLQYHQHFTHFPYISLCTYIFYGLSAHFMHFSHTACTFANFMHFLHISCTDHTFHALLAHCMHCPHILCTFRIFYFAQIPSTTCTFETQFDTHVIQAYNMHAYVSINYFLTMMLQ